LEPVVVDNKILKARVAPKLRNLGLSEEQKDQLIKELNYLSDLVIDGYLARKAAKKNDKPKTT
jgi:hypothetical protein